MVFNEILIPQDSFTETNVTRKRSVVGNSHLSQKNIYFIFYKILVPLKRYLIKMLKMNFDKINF